MVNNTAKLFVSLMIWIKENRWPLLLFLVLSIFIVSKSLYIAGCGSFGEGDDRVHTFPNLFLSRTILGSGEVPQMNFFDNFGTPLLGDGLTYPLAIQALTYWFFGNPSTAMAINTFLLSYLTMLALYVFLHGYFAKSIAVLMAIFIFWVPGFFEFFKLHQHQMALLPFVVALILLCKFGDTTLSRGKFAALFFVVLLVFMLSTSIDHVAVGVPILHVAAIFLGQERRRESFVLTAGVFIAAFLATLPQHGAFILHLSQSIRIHAISSGILGSTSNFLQTLMSFFFPAGLDGGTINPHLYLTFIVPAGVLLGIYTLLTHPQEKKYDGLMTLSLGILPLLLVFSLLVFSQIKNNLPIIKSVDLSRSIWYITPFIAVAFGAFLDQLVNFRVSKKPALIAGYVSILIFLWYFFSCYVGVASFGLCGSPNPRITLLYAVGILVFASLITFYSRLVDMKHSSDVAVSFKQRKIIIFLAAFGIFISLLPTPLVVLGMSEPLTCSGYYFTESERLKFYPQALLDVMEPFSRVASNAPSWHGYDETAVYNSVLGSSGRSIIANAYLANYLFEAKAVEIDDGRGDYHFTSPWNAELLERLGVRYVIEESGKSSELEKAGWQFVAKAENKRFNATPYLYENPKRPSPFYTVGENNQIFFIRDFEFKGNSALVTLPEIQREQTLVATFAYRPGWNVEIDGEPAKPIVFDDQLIRVNVKPGDKVFRISYNLFSWSSLLLFLAMGVVFLFLALRVNILINRLVDHQA